MDIFSSFSHLAKLSVKLATILWLVSLSIFLPSQFHVQLHIAELIKQYGQYAGIAFLFLSAYLAVHIFLWIRGKYLLHRVKKKLSGVVKNLDHEEKAILREYRIHGKHALQFPINDPTVQSLLNKHIVKKISNVGEHSLAGPLMSFSLTDTAVKLLQFEDIDWPMNKEMTGDDLRWLEKNRPKCIELMDIERKERERHLNWRKILNSVG